MRIRYQAPDSVTTAVLLAELLSQSGVNGSGQDFGDPVIISDDDFNNVF